MDKYVDIKYNQLCMNVKHKDKYDSLSIGFQRTLRIPDDNKLYSLPPGLGNFPLAHVEDYADKIPPAWNEHGGIFMPMYQAEAMWLNFSSERPFAIKIASGKINAVSGQPWSNELIANRGGDVEHDYIVVPEQPWLDGFNVGEGVIRQFVAMPMGEGYTVEEQLTGKAEHGGMQIIAYPMKEEKWQEILKQREGSRSMRGLAMCASASAGAMECADMGLAAGGLMTQEIYSDPYGIDAWDTSAPMRVFVHIMNSQQYLHVTGKKPPHEIPGPDTYKAYGYPWFSYYDNDAKVLSGSKDLAKVDSIASMQAKKGEDVLGDNASFVQPTPIALGDKPIKTVSSKKW